MTPRTSPRARETHLIILGAFLWLATTALAWAGHWFVALFVVLALMATYALLGIAHNGRPERGLLAFPILVWLVVWAGTFALAQHYAERFAGMPPDFTILGFHPSFAWIVLAYWLVGTAVMVIGFYWRREAWLSEARWQEFLSAVRADGHGKAD